MSKSTISIMSKHRREVLIYQHHVSLPSEIQEVLHQKGFASQRIIEQSALFSAIKKSGSAILIIDGGNSTKELDHSIRFLVENVKSLHCPVLLTGKDAEKRERELERVYNALATVSTPCSNSHLVDAVLFLAEEYERERERIKASAAIEAAHLVSAEASEPKEHSFSESVINELTRSSLSQIIMRGDEYLTGIDVSYLRSNGFYPGQLSPAASTLVDETFEKAGKWGKTHLCRTTFVCTRFAEALGLPEHMVELGKQAALLYASAFISSNPELIRTNYLRRDRKLARKELASRLKDSAMKISMDLKHDELGKLIATMARILAEEGVDPNDPLYILGSCLVAADLVDRTCYQKGFWDPRLAHNLMSKVKAGDLSALDPQVVCCVVKFLSEAVISKLMSFVFPRDVRKRAEELKSAEREREKNLTTNEVKVPITSLVPGMKLSRPLFSYDGKEILGQDLILDEDLIWRLWQLAAIRPLSSALVTKS